PPRRRGPPGARGGRGRGPGGRRPPTHPPPAAAPGRTARCGTILVDCGNETEWRLNAARTPHHVVDRIDLAADIVVREAVRRHGSWVRR
ncbi:hypothetical protein PPI47_35730, partial [Burkholderia cenocepacia]|nr:hypothetical protein [Burkholderia cenocepacia]